MTHQWHDTYHHARTPAHHLDPRSKIFVGLVFVGTVLFTQEWGSLQKIGYPALLLTAILLTRLSFGTLMKRALSVMPFALLMLLSVVLSHLSVARLQESLIKSALSVTAMALVSMTTPFPDFLRALEQCRTPSLLVMFLAFLYRYVAVIGKEIVRVERGWTSRSFGRFWWREWSRLGHVLATLLIRSYERAERIYAAMLARGFSNRMPAMKLLHFGVGDVLFVGASCGCLILIRWGRWL